MVKCECLKRSQERRKYALFRQRSGLVGGLTKKTFENYKPLTPSQQKALEVAARGTSFYLYGDWGVGKTHLLAASVNEALKRGQEASLVSVPWLLQAIREEMASRGNGDEGRYDLFRLACEIPYLALDDLGKEKVTDFVKEKIFMIFDVREINGLRTSVSSNLDPDVLFNEDIVDPAVLSRIRGMCGPENIIEVEGRDYRQYGPTRPSGKPVHTVK
jgi:DNA replication protein DnaC